ncbi:MAG: TetR/AcrR family transcriptional regulator [Solirubrobacterales bacterium]|nr:TetR/AcrR family transcriptional regulator [Solirubrobacterales bacterium]
MAPRKAHPGAPRVRRNREDEVLLAAIDIFHRKGYATASIQDVADSVGVLKGSLYHYIDTKEDLLARIFAESDDQSHAIMQEIAALDINAVERLRIFARTWSLWYLENLERSSLYFNEWRHLTGERLTRITAQRHRYELYVTDLIDAVVREGKADPDLNTRYAAFFVLSAINVLPSWYKRGGPDSPEHIAEVWSDLILGMVCHSQGRRRPRSSARVRRAA